MDELEGLLIPLVGDASALRQAVEEATRYLNEQAAAAKTTEEAMARHNKSIMDEVARTTASVITPVEAYGQELARLNAIQTQLDPTVYAKALEKARQAYEDSTGATAALNAERAKAAAIIASVRTEEEDYADAVRELTALQKKNLITEDQLGKAQNKLWSNLSRVKTATQEATAADEQAKRVKQSLLSPLQRYEQEAAQIVSLQRSGRLTTDEATAALRRHRDELERAGRAARQWTADQRASIQAVQDVGRSIESIGQGIQRFGTAWTVGITTPVLGFGALGVREFASFDKAMVETIAIMGDLTQAQKDALEGTVLGMKSKFSSEELAQGLHALAAAGLDVDQTMGSLVHVERFAVAGAMDLNNATTLLTNSVAAFYPQAKTAEEYTGNLIKTSDALAKAADQSTAEVKDFAEALGEVGADAAGIFRMELETTMAVLDSYAMKNIKGKDAGNSMARALRLTAAAVRENGELWEMAGIQPIDKATGEFKNFIEIIGEMETAMAGMTGPQKGAFLQNLGFENLAQNAILPLLGTADAMRKWQEEQRNAAGYTGDVAAKQMKAFTNEVETMWNEVKKVAGSIGTMLVPYLRMGIDWVMKATEWWNKSSDATKWFTVAVAGAAAVMGPLIVGVGFVIASVGAAVVAIAAFVAVGWEIILVVVGVIAHLALFAAAVIAAGAAILGFSQFGMDGMMEIAATATQTIIQVIRAAQRMVVALLGWLGKQAFDFFVFKFPAFILQGLSKLVEYAGKVGPALLKALLTGDTSAVQGYISQLLSDFSAGANSSNIGDTLAGIAQEELGGLDFFKDGKDAATSLAEGIAAGTVDVQKQSKILAANALVSLSTGGSDKLALETVAALEKMNQLTKDKAPLDAAVAVAEKQKLLDAMAAVEGQKQLTKSIGETTARLKEEVDAFGKGHHELEIMKLKAKGATDAQLAEALAHAQKLDQLEAEKKEMEKATEIAKKYKSPLEKLKETEDELDSMRKKGLISFEAYSHEMEAAQKEMKNATKVADKYKTPLEKLKETEEELTDLRKKGSITFEAFREGMVKAQTEAAKGLNVEFSSGGVEAVLADSAEAAVAMSEYMGDLQRQKATEILWGAGADPNELMRAGDLQLTADSERVTPETFDNADKNSNYQSTTVNLFERMANSLDNLIDKEPVNLEAADI